MVPHNVRPRHLHPQFVPGLLTPKVDPVTLQNEDEDDGGLPTSNQEEFRPFIRRLPEFKFWYSMTKAVLICLLLSLFEFTNIPVFLADPSRLLHRLDLPHF